MIRRIFPISLLLALISGFGLIQAWQNDYKDQLPFILPKAPQFQAKSSQV
jgi:hypothetical protein